MISFLSRLMPRERRFFELFDQHAGLIVEASVVLVDLLRNFEEQAHRNQRIARILELEHAADKVTRETVSLLHQTFVTPLDRDDIHRMISRMDDVVDLMQDTAEALHAGGDPARGAARRVLHPPAVGGQAALQPR
jgi:uncharacterized protein Yka (UPF0111/DUF47 family)